VAGCDIEKDPIGVRRRVGYVPENAPLYGDMTVRSFLEFVCDVRELRGQKRKDAIERVGTLCHLEGVYYQPIETLSKGFKRRVGLAQALLHDPQTLVLDEPTDGLDPNQKHDVREMIRGMGRDKCIVVSTHILEEVDAVCTRAIIIARGRVLADGSPDELRGRGGGRLDAYFRQITIGAGRTGKESVA
jgi:ABC-2 type transport system ATP-binding protein